VASRQASRRERHSIITTITSPNHITITVLIDISLHTHQHNKKTHLRAAPPSPQIMFRRQVLQHAARPLRQQLSAQQAQQLGSAAAACGSSIQQSSGGAVGDGGGSSWTTITARRLLATLSSSTSSSSSSSAAAAAAAACQQPWRQWAGAHARRQLFSSAEGGQGGGGSGGGAARKSMLDASLPHSAAMEGVAATRLRAAAAAGGDAGGAGSAGAGAGARGPFRRVLSWLFDAAIIASLAAVLGGGVAYASYSVGEVQELLAQATQAQEAQGEASLPQAAWVKLLQLYLAVAEPLDAKVWVGCKLERCMPCDVKPGIGCCATRGATDTAAASTQTNLPASPLCRHTHTHTHTHKHTPFPNTGARVHRPHV
jgi:hypothetical protein